jgi:hypothetical protein
LPPAVGLGAVCAGQNIGRAAAPAGELEPPIGLGRGVVARRRRQRRRLLCVGFFERRTLSGERQQAGENRNLANFMSSAPPRMS